MLTSVQKSVQLWEGHIFSEQGALQLLLIVDYIFDWARDVYRPSILRQLKSLATGGAYDEITVTDDSDLASLRGDIVSWIPSPPSARNCLGPNTPLGHPSPNPKQIGATQFILDSTKIGAVRSASLVDCRFAGLCIQTPDVVELLQFLIDMDQGQGNLETAARDLVEYLGREGLLLLSARSLDYLGVSWTSVKLERPKGLTRTPATEPELSFYTKLEFANFINPGWRVVREITYLAFSESALHLITHHANLDEHDTRMSSMMGFASSCDENVLYDTLHCLRSGSFKQVFMAAVRSLSFSLSPLPDVSDQSTRIAKGLRITSNDNPFLRRLILAIHESVQRKDLKTSNARETSTVADQRQRIPFREQATRNSALGFSTMLPSLRTGPCFISVGGKQHSNLKEPTHTESSCCRCLSQRRSQLSNNRFPFVDHTPFPADNMAFVKSLDFADGEEDRDEFCAYVPYFPPEYKDPSTASLLVKDLHQLGALYYTLPHLSIQNFNQRKIDYTVRWSKNKWNASFPFTLRRA